ncbi:hypothetical protein HDV05_003332 [Chytridiales sp. JEL 0842]|nr:hypothetical protein HDV05_003332 [Chytridiales sp. JEL 0842]
MKSILPVSLLALQALTIVGAQDLNAKPKVQMCDPKVLPPGWEPGKVEAPLEQVSQFQALNRNNPLTCTGTVVVLDGCTFMIRNFTFLNALQTRFYAGIVYADATGAKITNQNGVNFVQGDISASNLVDSPPFRLVQDVSVGYSFTSINELRLFDVTQQQVVCVAQLPYDNPFAKNVPAGAVTSGVFSAAKPGAPAGSGTETGAATASSTVTTKSSAPSANGDTGARLVVGAFVATLLAVFAL